MASVESSNLRPQREFLNNRNPGREQTRHERREEAPALSETDPRAKEPLTTSSSELATATPS